MDKYMYKQASFFKNSVANSYNYVRSYTALRGAARRRTVRRMAVIILADKNRT